MTALSRLLPMRPCQPKRQLKQSAQTPKKRERGRRRRGQTDFMEKAFRHVEHLHGKRSASTVQNYLTALRSFRAFLKAENVHACNTMTAAMVEAYDRWLAIKGLKPNSRSCYLRSLRALFNAVTPDRMRAENPFLHVFTGNATTVKRAVDTETINALNHLEFSDAEQELRQARDMFLFCTFAMGMPFVDAYHLHWKQVSNGVISYTRHKTGQLVRVKIEPCMKNILNSYKQHETDRVFPIRANYAAALNKYNRLLHVLSRKANLRDNITSYVARHTWATIAYHKHVDINLISLGMGHANSNTTSIYIKKTDEKQLWEANRKIIKSLCGNTSAQEV